ncbi:MAG: HIT family protein [Bacteroides sp.]|nr:HIT family protein [Barnesiella sp.]MBD5324213.1 HIT family protein [Bacteroides sp.]MBD5330539.1 HIT family protein [Bacteroides sp.]MBD5374793.1 HIT family protein [Bacteroides sp.]MDE7461196.1 HIT family protein [Paramuribaculum sp.]
MATIFSKIISGEIPCYKIAEDERYFAFLDINPVAPGHTLVVPKREVSYLFDLTDEEYVGLELFAKRVAEGLREAMPCKRIGEAVIGLEVPHAHIHLIPINTERDMDFSNKQSLPGEQMASICARIKEAVDKKLGA